MFPYIPATEADKKEMLKVIGVDNTDRLFDDIPSEFRLKEALSLPNAKSELEVMKYMERLASMNKSVNDYTCFLGAGAYDHYVPTTVDAIISRSEFYTSYTPYQPEISQGTLQYIFEFQTLITRLTGMDVANASLYDGGTACAEAAIMACANAKRKEIVVSKTINPSSMAILKAYCHGQSIDLIEVGTHEGRTCLDDLKAKITPNTAGVILQSPNFFGLIEDVAGATEIAHTVKKCSMILSTDPFVLPVLRTPAEYGVDIVVGEAQSIGLALNYGGPYVGIIAAKEEYMRKMPGRLVGQTVDADGKRSFVLTLAAREQHIRREKATSNICTNQGLMTLACAVHMCTMGKAGMTEAAAQALSKAHYAFERLTASGTFKPLFKGPFFLEFALTSDIPAEKINKALLENGILGGYALEKDFPELKNAVLFAVTEKRTKEEIDRLVEVLEGIK